MGSCTTIESLPENLLQDICLYVGNDSVKYFHTLPLLSKTFLRVCNGSYVMGRVSSFHGSPFGPGYCTRNYREKYNKFVKSCDEAGNPETAYRLGCVTYFQEGQVIRGIERLAFAAEKGIEEAQYLYGLILVCLGDCLRAGGKEEGYQLLVPFKQPLVEKAGTFWWTEQHRWMKHIRELQFRAQPMVLVLKGLYDREKCKCDGGKQRLYADPGSFSARFDRFERLVNMLSSVTCQICLCHHLVQMFFEAAEECRHYRVTQKSFPHI